MELVSEKPSLDLETLLHKPPFLQLSPDGSGIHGQIYRAAQGDSGKRLTRYSVTLRPQLSYLAHPVNQRIFQNLTVPKIIGMVLEEHGIQSNAYEFKTGSIYPERIYCVQYDESTCTSSSACARKRVSTITSSTAWKAMCWCSETT